MDYSDPRLKGFKKFEYIDDALKKFFNSLDLNPVDCEVVNVSNALGRVLGEDVISNVNVPHFSRAAMDGYAVISEDTIGASFDNPIRLKIVGESAPGKPYRGQITKGEAVRISTGAKMPEGSNAVVMVEYTKQIGDYVEIYAPVGENQNVSKVGEDIKKGEIILKKGTVLEPFDLSLLYSIGITKIAVRRKVRVAVGAVGSELVDANKFNNVSDNQKYIIETNRIMISSALSYFNCEIVDLGIISDDEEDIKDAIIKGLNEADIVVLTGGSSVGKYDYIPNIINELGEPGVIVHGVTAHPGRPVALASINGKPIINLPGYPVAAYVDFLLFVPPIIFRLLGISGEYIPLKVKAVLDSKVPSKPGTRSFVRVKLVRKGGEYHAIPIRLTGAGVLSSLSKADGFLIIPEDLEGLDKGSEVEVLLIRRFIS